jgi:GNAT superfamily N-acetyltransferase
VVEESYINPGQAQFEQGLVVEAVGLNRVIGFYTLDNSDSTIKLSHLFVDRGTQRQGVGRSLLEKALLHSYGLGAEAIELIADPHAKDFYRKAGAEVIRVINENRATQHTP